MTQYRGEASLMEAKAEVGVDKLRQVKASGKPALAKLLHLASPVATREGPIIA